MLPDRKNSLANSRRPPEIYPEFSKGAVNRAGRKLAEGSGTDSDAKIIENWRAAHSHILNTFQATLRLKAKKSGVRPPVQRIKRLKTIENKLLRYPGMQLARMHDIVGCRVIFNDIDELNEFRKSFNRSRFVHKRKVKKDDDGASVGAYNYINVPKESGYRGIHDVFEFRAKQSGKENSKGGEKWNGLLIEIQYRTNVQHAWATAVEICDSYKGHHGKFSDAPEEYLRYFLIASELLARKHENFEGYLSAEETFDLLVEFVDLEYRYGMLAT